MFKLGFATLAIALTACTTVAPPPAADSVIADRIKQLTRSVQWKRVATIPVGFNTHHPQGMVKIGEFFFVTAVDIRTPTQRFAQLQNGYDRDTGAGQVTFMFGAYLM